MDYVGNSAQRANHNFIQRFLQVGILLCFWSCHQVRAAELPGFLPLGDTNPPLVTIPQFLDGARQWGETNNLRLQGVVTATLDDKTYFIQEGDAGVYVFHRPAERLQVGDRVEVTGHPSLGNIKPLLDGLGVRTLGQGTVPPPTTVTFADVMTGQHHMRLIRIRGRLAEERPRGGRNLILNAGGSTNSFIANMEAVPDYEAVAEVQPGSLIELTGVASIRADATRTRPVSLTVFARSAADAVVVSGPPWWTHERTVVVLIVALGVLLATLLWSWTLRRQVGRQTSDLRARLEKEMSLEQRYRQLFESNPHPMWVYDLNTLRFLAVNEAAIHHYGYSLAEFLGMTLRDIRPPEEVPALEQAVASVTPGLNPSGVWRHRKKNGEIIEVEIKSHTIDFDGRAAEVVLALDVTERRRAESALRASEQYRRAIIEAEPECVKVVSADGALLDMNRAGLDMLEAGSLAEAASCPLMRFVRPEYQQSFGEMHRRVLAGGSGMLEFEIEGLKGTRRWLETHAVLLPGADRGKPALLGITRDVTERKKAQAEAQRSQERFATIFRASPDAIMIARVSDERIVEINPAFERLLGFPASEALGRTTLELGLWVNLAERAVTIATMKATGTVSNGEARLRSKDGRIFDALSSAEIITYNGERCMMSLTRDISERKAAEERLRRSEASLAAAQRIAALGSWELDLSDTLHTDRNPLTWSDEVFRIFGYEPGAIEVTNENFFRAVHPDDRERVQKAVAEAVAERRPYRIDHRIIRPDGTERIVQEYSETDFDPATGRPLRMLGVVQDITERKAAEAELQERERAYATLLRNLAGMVYRCRNDADWTTTFVSNGCVAVTGYHPEDLIGNRKVSLAALMHPEDAGPVWEKCQANLAARRPCSNEYRIRTAAGEEKWVWDQAQGVYSATGELIFIEGYISDITERKQAEAALAEAQQTLQKSERHFRALIEQSSDGIAVFGADGVMRYVSPAAATITGYEVAELIGSNALSHVHEEDLPAAENRFRQMVSKPGMTERFEQRLRRKDGTTVWIEVAAQNLLRDAAVQGIVVNYRDVTERLKAERALSESRERHAELVRTIEGIVWEADARTFQFTFVSEQAERLIGFPVEKWLEPGFWAAHIHQDDRDATTEYCVTSTRQGLNHDFEYRMLAADGRVVWLRDIVTVLVEQGAPRLLRGIMVDITDRKEAELARQRAFETLQIFIDSVPGYVSFVDAGQRYQLVNPGYEEWFGRKRSEIVGRRLDELHPPGAYQEMRPMVERALAGEVVRYERALDDAAGRAHWFDIRYIPRAATDGAGSGFFALVFDITAQKEAELALRDSRERLDGILTSLDDAVWSSTPDGSQMLYLNPAAEKIYGRPIAEFFANPHLWLESIHQEDRAAVGAAFEEIQRSGTFVSEYRILRPDGTMRWIRDRGRIVKDAAGRALRLDGIGTDITTQREAEERIRNINTELEQRVQERTAQIDRLYRRQAALAEIEVAVNQPSELQRVLDRAVAVGGEGMGTRGGASIVLWDAQQECFTVSASTVPGQPGQLAALRIRSTGGASRWIVDHRQPLLVPDVREDPFRANAMLPEFGMQSYAGVPLLFEEQALGVFYILHNQPRIFSEEDVSFMQSVASRVAVAIFKVRLYERVQGVNRILRQRSAELEAANKELEAFSYSVSHDLRAPLRAIDGFSKILEQDASSLLDEKCLRYLDRIRSGTERMSALIDDMLKLSRLSRAPMKRVEVDLSLMVGEALAEFRAAEPERQVETVVAPDLKAEGDASLLRAVLQNFVSNAWKYTSRRPKARIEFGALERDGERVFFIRDDGAGFDMAYADKLFGAFQRLHGVDEFEGTGIGLATVQRVIHRHGGRVWAEASVNQGATFYFTLAPKIEPT
jgi:PAS domain S-box-containing protein